MNGALFRQTWRAQRLKLTVVSIALIVWGFLLPVMFQVIFGMTAFDAGLLVACFLAGDLGVKFVANQIVRRFGFRTTLIADGFVVAATALGLMWISPQTPLWVLIPLLFFAGASRSVHFTALNSLVFADMPQEQIGNASTLNSMIQQVMMGNYRKLIPCVMQERHRNPGLTDIDVEFVVLGSGKVSAVRVNGQRNGTFPACVLGRMQGFGFPSYNGKKTIASWSLSMR